jgi:hypothetical protein
MNLRRLFRISVARTSRTRFTVQELADFVELCARRDLDPSTPVTFFAAGQEVRDFRMEVSGEGR